MVTKTYSLLVHVDDEQNVDVRILPAFTIPDVAPTPAEAGSREDVDLHSGPHVFWGDNPADNDEPRPHVRTPDPRGGRR